MHKLHQFLNKCYTFKHAIKFICWMYFFKAEEDREFRERQLEQEERMAKEMARIHDEKLRDEKMRQYIKENRLVMSRYNVFLYLNSMFILLDLSFIVSAELRELELKLKSAYLNRERAAQVAEKETMRYEATVSVNSDYVIYLGLYPVTNGALKSFQRQEAAIARKIKEELERAQIENEKQEQKRYEEVVRYQQDLEQQLEEKERKRQEAYEEFIKEKLLVDEIVRKIYEEDQM